MNATFVHDVSSSERLVRVFPRRTVATPEDGMARVGRPSLWDHGLPPDRVYVSVTWTWDRELGESIAGDWSHLGCDVRVGGPAYDDRGEDFWPGFFLKQGYTITSRGCPNSCWFCDAWRREGREIRELPIMPGHNVLDNNLLACSREHISSVFRMLASGQNKPSFTGGFEAARLQRWHVNWLVRLRPKITWFAYDTEPDYAPLVDAAALLSEAGLMNSSHCVGCYVLAGWNRTGRIDRIEDAEARIRKIVKLGFFPQAMLLDDGREWDPLTRRRWKEWAARWTNKRTVGSLIKKVLAKA